MAKSKKVERVRDNYSCGMVAGRVDERERLYHSIDSVLVGLSEQLADGRLGQAEYRLMEATTLYILSKVKERGVGR